MNIRSLLALVSPASARRTRRTCRLNVEALEDRYVPAGTSALIADSVGDLLPTYTVTQDQGQDSDWIGTDTQPWLSDNGVTWGIINGHDLTGTTVPPGLLIPVNTFQSSFGYVIMKEFDGEVSDRGELQSLRLNMAMERTSKFFETLTNVLAVVSDVQAQITSSIK